MKLIDETKYVDRILEGETELYAYFLRQYSNPVYTLIIQMVSSPEDAEELTQDVFVKAFRNLHKFRGESSFLTWIYRIAYNTGISATRKRKQNLLYIEESQLSNVTENEIERLLECDNEEKIKSLTHAIEKLTAEEKAIITLFYYEEKPIEQIADILKISHTNGKVRLHRIRKKLYLLMKKDEEK